jgi:hypothetical protein
VENKYVTFLISAHNAHHPAVSLGKWENAERYAENILEVRPLCIRVQANS